MLGCQQNVLYLFTSNFVFVVLPFLFRLHRLQFHLLVALSHLLLIKIRKCVAFWLSIGHANVTIWILCLHMRTTFINYTAHFFPYLSPSFEITQLKIASRISISHALISLCRRSFLSAFPIILPEIHGKFCVKWSLLKNSGTISSAFNLNRFK